jgi:rare lipoprotein A
MPAQARANALPQQQTQSSPSSSLGPRVSYPRAEILGASIISGRSYRLQIGSFKVAKNAVEVFDRLTAAGLSPKWEPFEDYYRVVLTNVPAEDMQQVASKLGGAGFKEVIAREER